MSTRVINMDTKNPLWFTAGGCDWLIAPKSKELLFWHMELEEFETPAMNFRGGTRKRDEVSGKPLSYLAKRPVAKSSKVATPGSVRANYAEVPDHVAQWLKSGEGQKAIRRCNIDPRNVVYGKEALNSLDQEIQAKQAQRDELEAHLEKLRTGGRDDVEKERADLLLEVAALREEKEAVRRDLALAKAAASRAADPVDAGDAGEAG